MFSKTKITRDKAFKEFLKNKEGLKEKSVMGYISAVRGFSNNCEKLPSEFIEICKQDLRDKVLEFDSWLLMALESYKSDMQNKRLRISSIRKNLTLIRYFIASFHF